MSKEVVIIIPIYKNTLTYNEAFSLRQCFEILGTHKIIVIKPISLNLSPIADQIQFAEEVSFADKYFKDIQGYNELMLSTEFYKTFLDYQYMLIYQLDALVFSDELLGWCRKKYDYIGAPWLYPTDHLTAVGRLVLHIKSSIYKRYNISKNGLPKPKQFLKRIGNGGLSLRRTKTFHDLSIKFKDLAQEYNKEQRLEFNEDIFWSIAINRKKKNLKVPHYKTALKFSVETCPEIAFRLNHDQLPFGCHAWDKNLDFWMPILQRFNYNP